MWLAIDKNSDISLIRQIYGQIKSFILEGKLGAGDKLPSTRWLSEDLKISRNVILEAYEQLMAEGYIESIHGLGTVVAKGSFFKSKETTGGRNFSKDIEKEDTSRLIDFRSGIPELNLFPKEEWGSLLKKICLNSSISTFRYCEPEGSIELRNEISEYLFRARGVNCKPEQIMIISGSTQGLSLVSKLFYKPHGEVIVEDPIHYGLLNVISTYGGYLLKPIPVDDKGIRTDMLKDSKKVEFIYVTPSHQFPLGGVMPIQRRIELIKFAEKNNCYIIEDDYDSEFRYEGQPISSLHELEPSKVIYIGSFSKILAPALRLGYMILPGELIPEYKRLKMYSDVHTETIAQIALAKFIKNGKLEKHIWKMKKEYNKKRQAIIKNLEINFPNQYIVEGQATGLHLVVKFKNISFTEEIMQKIIKENVKVYPVENYAINKGFHENEIILGYGHLSINEIEEGIRNIKKALYMYL